MSKFAKPDFPYTILDVVNNLGLQIRKIKNNEMYIDCPECHQNGHNDQGHCQVLLSEGVYSCQHCGQFEGGILDLYCYYRNVDRRQANMDMRQYVKAPVYKQRKAQVQKIVMSAEASVYDNANLANRKDIDRTYRTLLSLCTLAQEHEKDLFRRGLTEKNIAHFGFKTVPVKFNERRCIVSALLERGCKLEGVPGFYKDKFDEWNINIYEKIRGYFVPMCNLQNECLGLQIRVDSPENGRKYVWLSSKNKYCGVGRTSVPHITNTLSIGDTVYFTEGGLKADIAHCLSHKTFIAIAGVTQYKVIPILFSQLKKNGVKRVVDSYDADCKYNQNVEIARQKLKGYALKAGLEYYRMEWDEQWKGIDDYLLAHPKGTREFNVYDK